MDQILAYWPQLLVFAMVVAGYTELKMAVRTNRKDIDNAKDELKPCLQEIKTTLNNMRTENAAKFARLETEMKHLKEK